MWVRSPLKEVKYLHKIIFPFLRSGVEAKRGLAWLGVASATQHEMPPVFGRKWETECLNTRFHLPTLLYAGYSEADLFFIKYLVSSRGNRPYNLSTTLGVTRVSPCTTTGLRSDYYDKNILISWTTKCGYTSRVTLKSILL